MHTKRSFTIGFLMISIISLSLYQCGGGTPPEATATAEPAFEKPSDAGIKEGKALAAKYCQSCHQLPDPSLLPRRIWEGNVLPAMGMYLGIKPANMPAVQQSPESDLNYLPDKPAIGDPQWKKIMGYYIYSAPEALTPTKKPGEVSHTLPFFEVEQPSPQLFSTVSIASMVKIDNSTKPVKLIVNDGIGNKLIILDNKLQQLHSYTLHGPVVDMLFQKDGIMACTIGKDLAANNLKNGEITRIQMDAAGAITGADKPLFSQLARPVSVVAADLDKSGRPGYLVAQYGNFVGGLSWMQNLGPQGFKEHVLRAKPGCLKVIVKDANADGLPDIYALFAQGDEGIFLFINKGNGQFDEKRLLSFPPSYGSSNFDLADMDKDGRPDIIYTCGDNGDYSQVLKPYHGMYIYLNKGDNKFEQKYFYPINGCYKAIARDFDGDGDLDIATISNFPAAVTPWEAFIYLENKGDLNFKAYTLPENVPFQKGLTMDAGDIDGDGKPDLLLGNGFYTSDKSGRFTQPLCIVLKNITNK